MDKIEKIRQEIERRFAKYDEHYTSAGKELNDLLFFIKDLMKQGEPDKSLEEAAKNYTDSSEWLIGEDLEHIDAAFIAGAKWQEEQDTREMIKSDGGSFRKCYELGKKDIKEQMMKEAMEFECIGKKVKMTVQELINYYIDAECCDVADECGF